VQEILKNSTDSAITSELDKNQDSNTYEKDAKIALEHDNPRRAYYVIRNNPALKKYLQPTLQKCKLLAKKHEDDVSTTIAETCYRTIVQICLEQDITDSELELTGDKLRNKFPVWAIIAYYLMGKKEKLEAMERHEGH
jgi:hypothetical protein